MERTMRTCASGARAGGVLVWFRRDLRIHDNEVLHAAGQRARELNARVDFCYVHRKEHPGGGSSEPWHRRQGGASLAFLGSSLVALNEILGQTWGAELIFKECQDDHDSVVSALAEVARACGSTEVYFGRCYEPKLREEETKAQLQLSKAHGIRSRGFNTYLLHEPSSVAIDMRKWKGHFGTLMPFYTACKALPGGCAPAFPVPVEMPVRDESVARDRGWSLGAPSNSFRGFLFPEGGWVKMLVDSWSAEGDGVSGHAFGEVRALQMLAAFVEHKMKRYESSRGYADARAVSKLSPYLHFGVLSSRYMVSRLQKAGCESTSKTFWRRLVWRDLAYWQLHHWPLMATQPIRSFYCRHEWRRDEEALEKWKTGQTGYPLVDAGMRELWQTGWMQQNARMCCALFLTEYLNISWAEGAAWFHDTLFDADLAINSMMWQNAGKSGLDQWNFTVGPTAKSLDPTGAYIKEWVPELRGLPPKFLHAPWEATEAVLAESGVELGGGGYPERMVEVIDVGAAKVRNLEAVRKLRKEAKEAGFVDGDGYDIIKAPRGSCRGAPNKGLVRVFTRLDYRGGGGGQRGRGGQGRKRGGGTSSRRGRNKGGKQGGASKQVFKQLSIEEAFRL